MASNVLIAAAALFALLSAQCTAGKPEAAILQEGDNGSAVVLLAIARLQQSGIFPDDNMMTTNCCEGLRTLKLVMEQPKTRTARDTTVGYVYGITAACTCISAVVTLDLETLL